MQSLGSPTFRGLVEGKEGGRREETECVVTWSPGDTALGDCLLKLERNPLDLVTKLP